MATLADKLRAFDPSLPLARARAIPSAWYFDAEIHDAERRLVFGRNWLAAGRVDQVAKPGDFFTIEMAGEPVLVCREDEGTLRAFHNVCRHRAAQVINEPQGTAKTFRCRYHGWTYDLCGRLRGTPEFAGVDDFRREDNGLVPMAVDACGPFVFIHAGTPRLPLAEFLAPLPEKIAPLGLDRLHFVARKEYQLGCNWKVFVDNYLDGGYHVNTVHPGLAGAIDYARYHTDVFSRCSVQVSPLRPAEDATVGKVRTGDTAYYWWVYPNLMVNLYQGVMDTNLVLPLGPDRCKILFDFYFANSQGADAHKYIADSMAVADQVQMEDMGVCEEVQRGLKSASYSTGRFSVKREAGGYHFHQLLGRELAGSLVAP